MAYTSILPDAASTAFHQHAGHRQVIQPTDTGQQHVWKGGPSWGATSDFESMSTEDQGKPHGSDLLIDLLDESKDGSRKLPRGRRKSRSEGGWVGKTGQEPSSLKIQAGPLGMHLVEAMLGPASHKGDLTQSSNGFKLGASSFDHSRPGVQEPDNLDARDLEVLNFFQEASELWSDQHAWFPGLNGPAQPDQGVRQDPAWTIPAKIIPPQDAGPEQAMQSRSTSTQDQPPHSQDQQRAAKGAAPNIIMGDMTMAAREDVLQMLAARLHDDPAAVLELLEQTTAALLKRQAEPGTPKQPAPYASQAKQLTADDDSISARSIINGRLSQRPATSGPIEAAMPMDDRSTGAQLKLQPSFGSESADILNAALRTDAAAQPGKTGLPSFGSESSDALNAAVRSERTSDGRRESSRIYSKTNGSRDQGNRASSGMGEASPEERRQKSLDAPRTSSYSGMSRPPSQLGQMQAPAKAVRTASLKRVLSMSGLRGIRRWVSYPGYLTQSSFNDLDSNPSGSFTSAQKGADMGAQTSTNQQGNALFNKTVQAPATDSQAPLRDEDDWQSLVVEGQSTIAAQGQDPSQQPSEDQSSISPLSLDQALLSQCLNGSYYEARDSLKAGASVHTVDADGNTAVALACAAGHGRIIKMLMRKGADLNTANLQGNTPLHLAAANGRKAVVKFLISNRADKDACNSEGALYTDLAVTAAHDMPNADVEEI
ncbi:hypothetical protein WJX84_007280 [Apatococcus fuscideae]|uniref:Uncharacterized protein n=1 Tax=Apatococcus fuscideae TaxID=2026836 RepID=A0AAW1TCR2_9CHLO